MRRIGHGLDGFLAMLAILALALAQTKPKSQRKPKEAGHGKD
jgi:hypothetical protein